MDPLTRFLSMDVTAYIEHLEREEAVDQLATLVDALVDTLHLATEALWFTQLAAEARRQP